MKKNKYLGLGYLFVGAIFLFEPMVCVFDMLPDFIGYAFVLRGIYALADLNSYFEESKKQFRRLMFLSVMRLLSITFIFGMTAPSEQPTTLLLVSFVLAVIDSVLLVIAWKNLFEGFIYLATRLDGETFFYVKRACVPHALMRDNISDEDRIALEKKLEIRQAKFIKKGSITERLSRFTVVFFVLKEALATLPEFSALTDRMYTDGKGVDLYQYIGLLRCMAIIAGFVLGIIWIVRIFKYIKLAKSDTVFWNKLNEKYEQEVLAKPEIFAKRAVKRGIVCICAAAAFSIDLFVDGYNMIPDFLCAIALMFGIFFVRKCVTAWKKTFAFCAVYGVLSAVIWCTQIAFFAKYDPADIFKNEEVYKEFYGMSVFTLLGEIAFIIALVLVFLLLREIISKYTGFSITHKDSLEPDEKIKHIHAVLWRRFVIVLGVAVLTSVLTGIYFFTMPMVNTFFDAFWIIHLAGGVVFTASLISAAGLVFEQVEYKYMLM